MLYSNKSTPEIRDTPLVCVSWVSGIEGPIVHMSYHHHGFSTCDSNEFDNTGMVECDHNFGFSDELMFSSAHCINSQGLHCNINLHV